MISNAITSIRLVLLAPLFLLASAASAEFRWMALAVFLTAGLTDVLDGFVARKLGETSKAGAMLDLLADRLLTLTVVVALAASGALRGVWLAAGGLLIARDLAVATLNETLPGQLDIRVSPAERVKIALQFSAFALLIAPPIHPMQGPDSHDLGRWALGAAALLACATVVDYGRRAARAWRPS